MTDINKFRERLIEVKDKRPYHPEGGAAVHYCVGCDEYGIGQEFDCLTDSSCDVILEQSRQRWEISAWIACLDYLSQRAMGVGEMNDTDEIGQPVCPDCKGTDIADVAGDHKDNRGQPPWYCWNCGIRFASPHYLAPEE